MSSASISALRAFTAQLPLVDGVAGMIPLNLKHVWRTGFSLSQVLHIGVLMLGPWGQVFRRITFSVAHQAPCGGQKLQSHQRS